MSASPSFPTSAFLHTTEALRAGTNSALDSYPGHEPTLYQRLANNPEIEGVLHASMAAFTLQSMGGLLDNVDLTGVSRLLDIGGGDGTTARSLADRFPETGITVFDMPSVTRLAEREPSLDGPARVDFHPGDLFVDPFPADADAVLFSHVLEVFAAEQIIELLGKAFDALPCGGKVFLYGYNVTEDETRGLYSARLSLYLNVLASGQGMAYPAADYESWLTRVGFVDVRTIPGLPYEHGLTTAVKE
ncbi:methyltransferase [Streptomyces sp. NPDC099050]|uniref:methyltransferase n=1 Tax=Streptomyces sp. NPDC099050 TaxID=3366100 RepID=UPI00382654AF